MSSRRPVFRHPDLPKNDLGFTRRDYEGADSTLCAGCGHDSITNSIIQACFELSIEPHRVAKISGIGCSSKSPAYFLGKSHGFNSVHGRMPAIATGANMANKDLLYIGYQFEQVRLRVQVQVMSQEGPYDTDIAEHQICRVHITEMTGLNSRCEDALDQLLELVVFFKEVLAQDPAHPPLEADGLPE